MICAKHVFVCCLDIYFTGFYVVLNVVFADFLCCLDAWMLILVLLYAIFSTLFTDLWVDICCDCLVPSLDLCNVNIVVAFMTLWLAFSISTPTKDTWFI